MTLEAYKATQTYAGQTAACQPFELCRIRSVDPVKPKAVRTFRIVVVSKVGLGKDDRYLDVPGAIAEELTGRDRMQTEQWTEVPDSAVWASAAAAMIMRDREPVSTGLRHLAAICTESRTGDESFDSVAKMLESLRKNLGLLLNKTGNLRSQHHMGLPSLIELEHKLMHAVGRIATLLQPEGPQLDLTDIERQIKALADDC